MARRFPAVLGRGRALGRAARERRRPGRPPRARFCTNAAGRRGWRACLVDPDWNEPAVGAPLPLARFARHPAAARVRTPPPAHLLGVYRQVGSAAAHWRGERGARNARRDTARAPPSVPPARQRGVLWRGLRRRAVRQRDARVAALPPAARLECRIESAVRAARGRLRPHHRRRVGPRRGGGRHHPDLWRRRHRRRPRCFCAAHSGDRHAATFHYRSPCERSADSAGAAARVARRARRAPSARGRVVGTGQAALRRRNGERRVSAK
mmetsp:Transcript_4090/g.13128  ORF Transcript_4090/g.13128 Transcript_4090/m.13128 type:complete len:266 (+) Transcript_4090:1720-2517(+)